MDPDQTAPTACKVGTALNLDLKILFFSIQLFISSLYH